MALSNAKLNETLRNNFLGQLVEWLRANDEDVLQIKSNEICFPCVDSEGNDKFIKIAVSVPTGSRDDGEGFDGYGMAESYQISVAEKEAKAKEKAETKAKKIAKDKKKREEVSGE